ncbi:protoporphyrinogen oxidase [Myxococcota bacterium]|nr:protoporphyrinogen oxidase [Myxococcota bacterium]
MRAAIIGGGFSGLAAALRLKRAGFEVAVYEASGRLGGRVRSARCESIPLELGVEGFLDTDLATLELARDVGLGGDLLFAKPQRVEYLLGLADRLAPLPMNPKALLASPLLSLPGRLRALGEPLASPPTAEGASESVAAWATRRLGPEALTQIIRPVVRALTGDDPEALEAQSAYPALRRLTLAHGGYLRGALAQRRQRTGPLFGPGGRLITPREGMSDLIEGLYRALNGAVHLNAPARGLTRHRNDWGFQAGDERVYADLLVLALPAPSMAALLAPLDAALAEALAEIRYMGAERLALAFPQGGAPQPFGAAAALLDDEGLHRVDFYGALFRPQAPWTLVHALRHIPEPRLKPATSMLEAWRARFGGPPAQTWSWRFELARPRFELGHAERVARVAARLDALDGLHLISDALNGARLEDLAQAAEALPAAAMRLER